MSSNIMSKTEIVSSLPLQMALYFNAFYAPCWIIAHICTLAQKYQSLDITYQVILVAIHIFAVVVEAVRLYLGFVGNLMEKIPELSGFWITTLILQVPLTCFLLFHSGILLLPLEQAVDMVQMAFLLFEVASGLAAVRKVARHQVTKFQHQVLNHEETGQQDVKKLE